MRGSGTPMPPTDPLIYRFYELIMVNGPALKALIEEEFGDGIMSAIDFDMDIARQSNPKGDRVKIGMTGKFLPYNVAPTAAMHTPLPEWVKHSTFAVSARLPLRPQLQTYRCATLSDAQGELLTSREQFDKYPNDHPRALRMQLNDYSFKVLGPNDEAQLRELLESDSDYFKIANDEPPRPGEAKSLLSDLPEAKGQHDKFVYAVFDHSGTLVAVFDLVRGYPDDKTWFLGFLFVVPNKRNMGLGSHLLEAICTHVKQGGGAAIRLGVVRENFRARALYGRTGFLFLYERERTHANGLTGTIDVLERTL
jgi:ribosomal protein S18 acetylase RimI-like enzyme